MPLVSGSKVGRYQDLSFGRAQSIVPAWPWRQAPFGHPALLRSDTVRKLYPVRGLLETGPQLHGNVWWLYGSLPEFMNFKLFGKTILVVNMMP